MKKFIALILSLICIFAITFTACLDETDKGQGGTNNEQTGNKDDDNKDDDNKDDGNKDDDNKDDGNKDDDNKDDDNGSEVKEGYKIGNKLPDFTIETFESAYTEGSFSSADVRGKVLVINFWYTTCGICADEMPKIENVNNNFGDDVVVIALHLNYGSYVSQLAGAQNFINNKKWSGYNIIFGKDLGGDDGLFRNGGGTLCPRTVVLDGDGIITAILQGDMFPFDMEKFTYGDNLTPAIEAAMNK